MRALRLQQMHSSSHAVLSMNCRQSATHSPSTACALALQLDEDDDDDPFFMPMMPAAIKLAEPSKFSDLAKPLGKEEPKAFMIAMAGG